MPRRLRRKATYQRVVLQCSMDPTRYHGSTATEKIMPDGYQAGRTGQTTALVLAGGVSLGAYEAGAYAALHDSGVPLPSWVAGSSIGSVNAAIIAGNAPERRIERLQQFWETVTTNPTPMTSFWFGTPEAGPWRRAHNRASVLQTLCFGRPGIFRPRMSPGVRARRGRRVGAV